MVINVGNEQLTGKAEDEKVGTPAVPRPTLCLTFTSHKSQGARAMIGGTMGHLMFPTMKEISPRPLRIHILIGAIDYRSPTHMFVYLVVICSVISEMYCSET